MAAQVTVVIPTHNRSAWLAVTLHSVLWQQDVELDVVVVDDGSTDDTAAVVHAAGDRVRLVRHDAPLGVARSRNDGAAAATGDWVAFCDDDDVWAPDKLAAQLGAAARDGRCWAYAGAVTIDREHHVVGGKPPPAPAEVMRDLGRYNPVPGGGSNVVVRRDVLEQVGPFETRLFNTEDWEMWIRLGKVGAPSWVPRPLVGYRVHPTNASLRSAEILAGAALIDELHGTQADLGVLHRWLAEASLRSGNRAAAVRHLGRAARHGEIRGALGDAAELVARRVRRVLGRSRSSPAGGDAWIAMAEPWVAELAKVSGRRS